MNNILGEKIAQLRKNNNLSQEELAEKLFVSRQAISKWERGESFPELYNLIALSKLFNVSVDYLTNEEAIYEGKNITKGNTNVLSNLLISIGIALIILGTFSFPLIEEILKNYYPSLAEGITILIYGLLISISVFLILIAINIKKNYKLTQINEQIDQTSLKKFNFFSIIAISGISLATFTSMPYILLAKINENFAILIFAILLTFSVILIIFGFMQANHYFKLMGLKKAENKEEHKKKRFVTDLTTSACLLIFLIIGFSTNTWHPTWLIFLIIPIIEIINNYYLKK